MALTNPTKAEALDLFKDIEQHFPSALGSEKWYILTVSKHSRPVSVKTIPISHIISHFHRLPRFLQAAIPVTPQISTNISSPSLNSAHRPLGKLWSEDCERRW